MPAVMPAKLMQLSEARDPKKALVQAIGSAIDEIEVFGAQLLVATYIEPDKTAGGIWKPQSSVQESLYQGSIGLVLKKGPWAFQNDANLNIDWKGQDANVGDWVLFRYSSAWEQHLNGVSVRFVDDRDIKALVSSPALLTSKPTLAALA